MQTREKLRRLSVRANAASNTERTAGKLTEVRLTYLQKMHVVTGVVIGCIVTVHRK